MSNMENRILYEDNHLIAVNKIAGELAQSNEPEDESLENAVKAYLKEKYDKPGKVFLGIVHRIDQPVTGVILYARTSKALERMTAMMRDRKVQKKYHAIVRNKPAQLEGVLTHFLKRAENFNVTRVFSQEMQGAKASKLSYKLTKSVGKYFLLEIDLETGRHHQIRAQLSAIGCPIAGDVKYGFPEPLPDASVALHAAQLSFEHPVLKTQINIKATYPHQSIWDRFR